MTYAICDSFIPSPTVAILATLYKYGLPVFQTLMAGDSVERAALALNSAPLRNLIGMTSQRLWPRTTLVHDFTPCRDPFETACTSPDNPKRKPSPIFNQNTLRLINTVVCTECPRHYISFAEEDCEHVRCFAIPPLPSPSSPQSHFNLESNAKFQAPWTHQRSQPLPTPPHWIQVPWNRTMQGKPGCHLHLHQTGLGIILRFSQGAIDSIPYPRISIILAKAACPEPRRPFRNINH